MGNYKTKYKKVITELFKNNSSKSLNVNDFKDSLIDYGMSLSAIYRNLKQLEEEGLICKIVDPITGDFLYHYINPMECVDSIHLKCTDCGNTYHLDKFLSNTILQNVEEEHVFKINTTKGFLSGTCKSCLEKENIL